MTNLRINKKLEPFVREHKPFKVILGGRGSGKSIGVSDILIMKMYVEAASIMCLREFQQSIADSVHNVMCESITDRLCLPDWRMLDTRIIAPNGARTIYVGAARNPESLKSIHACKYGFFEEAQTASQKSLDNLLPTILRVEGAECWFVGNPMASGDPFSQKFIVPFLKELMRVGYYEDDMHMIVMLNWTDNPWWTKAADDLRRLDKRTMPRAKYDHVWEGAFNDSVENSIILPEWFDAAVDAHLDQRYEAAFEPHGAIVAAHDPFDDGGDAAGFCARHGSIITTVKSKSSGTIDEVCDWATGLAIEASADWFVWDGDGMGTGLRRQVSDAFNGKNTKYHMFKGSLSGSGQDNAKQIYMPADGDADTDTPKTYADTFKNNRAQFYMVLAKRFENMYLCRIKGKYVDPDEMISLNSAGIDDMVSLRSQLCRVPSKPHAGGLQQIMSKEDMKKLGIDSPNEADAVMMSMFIPPTKIKPKKIKFDNWNN